MRIARKLTLLLAMAIAATAFAATNASAIEPVTVEEEDGDLCTTPCTIHVVGESSLLAFHSFRISTCEDEFFADINANGEGEVTSWIGVNHPLGACTREMCTEPAKGPVEHWPLHLEEIGLNEAQLEVEFCLTPKDGDHLPASENRCDVDVHVTEEVSQNHHYFFDLFHECDIGGTPIEVAGSWETEEPHNPAEEDEVEIVHAP